MDAALAFTGKDVGTPIIQFHPTEGVAFFGPAISRLPTPDQAGPLWDNVVGLASFAGFAELKRNLRERPELRRFGVDAEQIGAAPRRAAHAQRADPAPGSHAMLALHEFVGVEHQAITDLSCVDQA